VHGERLKHLRELKAQFDTAHQRGMKALTTGDYVALDAAIRAEKAILDEQSALIKEQEVEIAAKLKRARHASDE